MKFRYILLFMTCCVAAQAQQLNTIDLSLPYGVDVQFPYSEVGIPAHNNGSVNLNGHAAAYSGYQVKSSNDPGGPTYDWNAYDVSSNQNKIKSFTSSPNEMVAKPLGFNFSFYGVNYSNVYISSNGFFTFQSAQSGFPSNFRNELPNAASPSALVAPYMDYIEANNGGAVYFKSYQNYAVIMWKNMKLYGSSDTVSFIAVLHSDGRLVFHYNNLSDTRIGYLVGIQNSTGTEGISYTWYDPNTSIQHGVDIRSIDPLAIQFEFVSVNYQWLSVSDLAIDEVNSTWNLNLDSSGLDVGQSYQADLTYRNDDLGLNILVDTYNLTIIEGATSGDDVLTGSFGNELNLEGLAGNDELHGGGGNDVISGGVGDDHMYGEDGDDDLFGGVGADYYYIGPGGGHDVIDDINEIHSTTQKNTVVIQSGIKPGEVYLLQGFNTLTLGQLDPITSDFQWSINIGQWGNLYSSSTGKFNYDVWRIQFDDGTVWDTSNILDGSSSGFFGSDSSEIIDGTPIDDSIRGGKGDDAISGRGGSDTYYFDVGDGVDAITDPASYDAANNQFLEVNTVVLPQGLTLGDLTFSFYPPYGLTINYGVSDSVTIMDWYEKPIATVATKTYGWAYQIKSGSTLLTTGRGLFTDGGDHISMGEVEGNGNVLLDFKAGDDYVSGFITQQGLTLELGAGNDISDMIGFFGHSHAYTWNWGHGHDYLNDVTSGGSQINTLYLPDSTTLGDLYFEFGHADRDSYLNNWVADSNGPDLKIHVVHPDSQQQSLTGSVVIEDWLADKENWDVFVGNGIKVEGVALGTGDQITPAASIDALLDDDGDRVPNVFESQRGTDPNSTVETPIYDAVVDPANSGTIGVYATIQEAINAVPYTLSGNPYYGVIFVKSGEYTEELYIPQGKQISLIAEAANEGVTVQSMRGGVSLIDVRSTITSFDGFTFKRAGAIDRHYPAVFCFLPNRKDLLRFVNCKFMDSRSKWGSMLLDSGTLVLDHVTISSNTGLEESTALYVGRNCDLHVRNSIIWSNNGSVESFVAIKEENASSSTVSVAGSVIEGGEYNSTNVDPLINVDGNLLHNSPARDFCPTLQPGLVDHHGESIDVGGADAGADQFTDVDSDMLPDFWEIKYGGLIMTASSDTENTVGDGLLASEEYCLGCSPEISDSDFDGVVDSVEALNGSSASFDFTSFMDSDGDRYPDFCEDLRGSDKLNPLSVPAVDATVDPSNAQDPNVYASVQEAIDTLPATDSGGMPYFGIILVKKGVHAGNISIPSEKQILFLGERNILPTILEPSGSVSHFIENQSRFVCFDGIVFNGEAGGYSESFLFQNPDNYNDAILHLQNCVLNDVSLFDKTPIKISQGSLVLDHVTVLRVASEIAPGRVIEVEGADSCVYIRNSVLWHNIGEGDTAIHAVSPSSQVLVVNSWIEGGEFGANDSDPRLTKEGYLIANSPLVDAGIPIISVAYDIHGELRPGTADVGADEYVDGDSSSLPDWAELPTSPYQKDHNGDGITLWEALYVYDIDDVAIDFDFDGIPNSYEISQGWDPAVKSSEGDFQSYLSSLTESATFEVFTEIVQ